MCPLSFPNNSSLATHQLFVQIAVLRFGKVKRRMDRLTAEAEIFRKTRDTAFYIRALRAWRADAGGRGESRKKIVAMALRRDKRVSGHTIRNRGGALRLHRGVLCRDGSTSVPFARPLEHRKKHALD